jgi:TusA-related sulfurtransferase
LRLTKCPLNFVKAKLAAEKLPPNTTLEVWLAADSDSSLNVPSSLRQEGFAVEILSEDDGACVKLRVLRP